MLDLKGRVVVYSTVGCPFCLRAKTLLRERDIPYFDISVDRFPDVRGWLAERTGLKSVPQIFFNETHIGGSSDLENLLNDEGKLADMMRLLKEEEPKDGELMIPQPSEAAEAEASDEFITFHCEKDPLADVVAEIENSDILQAYHPTWLSRCVKAFSGREFILWYSTRKNAEPDEAAKVGAELFDKKFIIAVKRKDTTFENDPDAYYKLNDGKGTTALNAGEAQNCLFGDASELAENLRRSILALYNDHLSPDGKVVSYSKMKESPHFENYVMMARELQRAPVESLEEDARKAFFINVYNALLIHGMAEAGPPTNWFTRLKFYDSSKYIIGGLVYSLNDIEHGVLRGNQRGFVQIRLPFGRNDARRRISLTKVDPRIHFTLNCGCKSCPPIKTFTVKDVNAELQMATEAYLEGDDGFTVDSDNSRIHLSSLFWWFGSDFGSTPEEILRWVSQNTADVKKKLALNELLQRGNWKVSYLPFDCDLSGSF